MVNVLLRDMHVHLVERNLDAVGLEGLIHLLVQGEKSIPVFFLGGPGKENQLNGTLAEGVDIDGGDFGLLCDVGVGVGHLQ